MQQLVSAAGDQLTAILTVALVAAPCVSPTEGIPIASSAVPDLIG